MALAPTSDEDIVDDDIVVGNELDDVVKREISAVGEDDAVSFGMDEVVAVGVAGKVIVLCVGVTMSFSPEQMLYRALISESDASLQSNFEQP